MVLAVFATRSRVVSSAYFRKLADSAGVGDADFVNTPRNSYNTAHCSTPTEIPIRHRKFSRIGKLAIREAAGGRAVQKWAACGFMLLRTKKADRS